MQKEFAMIADTIKELREKRGLTQEQLAEMVGISLSHMSKIESHIRVAGMQTYLKIMQVLDAPIEDSIGENGNFTAKSEKRVLQHKLWVLLQDCNEKELHILLHSVEGVKNGLRYQKSIEEK